MNDIYVDMIIKLLNEIYFKESFDLTIDSFLPLNKIKELELKILSINEFKNSKIKENSSEKIIGIQFADLIAGACFQKFERQENGYIEKINKKHNIYYY